MSKRIHASRSELLKLKKRLEIIRRGKNVLEMRRDQLISEIFRLIEKLKERAQAEKEFAYEVRKLSMLRLTYGDKEFITQLNLVEPPEFEIYDISIQGVKVPQVKILKDINTAKIYNSELKESVDKLWSALKFLLEIINIETAILKLVEHLTYINRVVNSLEKVVIPELERQVHDIEEKLFEEELEEHVRLSKIARITSHYYI